MLQKACDVICKENDDHDVFSAMVASKLRNMEATQRIFCENIISTALFKGATNKLSENSNITDQSSQIRTNFNINSILNNPDRPRNSYISLDPVPQEDNYDIQSGHRLEQYYRRFDPNHI